MTTVTRAPGSVDRMRSTVIGLVLRSLRGGLVLPRRPQGSLGVEVVTDADALVALAGEWRALLARSPLVEPVLTPTWQITWWQVFGRSGGRRLCVLTFRDAGGSLVGIAPLLCRVATRALVLPFVRLELLGSGEPAEDEIVSNYLGLIVEAGREEEVAQTLVATLRSGAMGRCDELQLSELSATDPMLEPLAHALRREGCLVETVPAGSGPFVDLADTREDYLETIGGRHRYFVRRTLRELESWAGEDGYRLHVATTQTELEEGMRILCELHEQRWSGSRPGGVFASARFCEFHERLRQASLDGGDVGVEVLWLEAHGRPVSALYNILYRDKVCFYQSGRSMWVPGSVRPGIAIHILAIERAIATGRRMYDLCGKENRYKMQLATGSRPRVTLRAVAPTARARALDAARNAARGLAARLPVNR